MNKLLLGTYVQPSFVVRIKERVKDKKIYTYFLIMPKSKELNSLEEYSFSAETRIFSKDTDGKKTINLE